MTSKNSFFKLVLDEARRNLWALALSVLGFLFSILLAVVIVLQSYIQSAREAAFTEAELLETLTQRIPDVMNWQMPRAGTMLMGALCGIVLFRYLHDRRQVDFYHALPIRRERLFWVKFCAGPLLVFPAYFVAKLLSVAVVAGAGYADLIPWGAMPACIGVDLLAFFFLYGVSILSVVLCGNTLFSIVLDGWLLFSPMFIKIMQNQFAYWFYPTYSMQEGVAPYANWCPVSLFLGIGDYLGTGGYSFWLLIYTVLGAAAIALSFLLFRRRRSERAGSAAAFEPLRLPLKLYTCIVVGLCFSVILMSIISYGSSAIWMILFTAIGTAVCHCVMEIIYHADFRACFRHAGTLAAVTAAAVGLALGLKADLFGYSTWIPSEKELQGVELYNLSVTIGGDSNNTSNYYGYSQEEQLTDPAVVSAMLRLAELGTENLELRLPTAASRLEREALEERLKEVSNYYTITISYTLPHGRREMRDYRIPITEESEAMVNTILYSEDYLRWHNRLFRYEEYRKEYPEKKPIAVLSDALRETDVYTTIDETQIANLQEALKADILSYTPGQAAQERAVAVLKLSLQGDRENWYPSTYRVYIYPSYQRTLALLKTYANYAPTPVTPEEVTSVVVRDYRKRVGQGEEGRSSYTTTDKTIIRQILENCVSGHRGDRVSMAVMNSVGVEIIFLNGSSTAFTYPVDDVPEELLTQLFGGPLDQTEEEDGASVYAAAATEAVFENIP